MERSGNNLPGKQAGGIKVAVYLFIGLSFTLGKDNKPVLLIIYTATITLSIMFYSFLHTDLLLTTKVNSSSKNHIQGYQQLPMFFLRVLLFPQFPVVLFFSLPRVCKHRVPVFVFYMEDPLISAC